MCICFFFQAEDGIRDLVRSRGLGDVYKRQGIEGTKHKSIYIGKPLDVKYDEVLSAVKELTDCMLSLIHI